MEKTLNLQSTITCPNCGFENEETMPTEACQYFYKCTNCETVLKPKQGDCCVFCSTALWLVRQYNFKGLVVQNQPDMLNSINLNHHYPTLP